MARASQAQEQTMDEILASIRRMISDDDGPATVNIDPRARTNRKIRSLFETPQSANDSGAASGVDNVVELAIAQAMEDARAEAAAESAVKAAVEAAVMQPPAAQAEEKSALAAANASDETRPASSAGGAEGKAAVAAAPGVAMVQTDAEDASLLGASSVGSVPAPVEEPHAEPLMSPTADAAVAGAFNRLAASMLSRSARTIDELVEDLLRPLLRNWLDQNLPPMVERMVREEIERVSRGRR